MMIPILRSCSVASACWAAVMPAGHVRLLPATRAFRTIIGLLTVDPGVVTIRFFQHSLFVARAAPWVYSPSAFFCRSRS
jgi:hypothetical protein